MFSHLILRNYTQDKKNIWPNYYANKKLQLILYRSKSQLRNRSEYTDTLLSSTTYNLVHCNYGWGGLCDGYYTQGTFDTTRRLASNRIDTAIGDVGCEGDYNFTVDIQIIQYSK